MRKRGEIKKECPLDILEGMDGNLAGELGSAQPVAGGSDEALLFLDLEHGLTIVQSQVTQEASVELADLDWVEIGQKLRGSRLAEAKRAQSIKSTGEDVSEEFSRRFTERCGPLQLLGMLESGGSLNELLEQDEALEGGKLGAVEV
jgi:hypothetical protein